MRKPGNRWFFIGGITLLIVGAVFTPVGRAAAASMKPLLVEVVNVPARQPFRQAISCLAEPGQRVCNARVSPPAGKLLVVETIAAAVELPPGQTAMVECGIGSGLDMTFGMPLHRTLTGLADDRYIALETVRLYAAPGEDVVLFLFRDGLAQTAIASLKISGHLVDCGTGPGCPLPGE